MPSSRARRAGQPPSPEPNSSPIVTPMLARRDSIPHFVVTSVDGSEVRYADIWQRRFLVLVCVPAPSDRARAYAAALELACARTEVETTCVVTATAVDGLPAPAAVVADRYGEVAFVAAAHSLDGLPLPDDLADWVRYIGIRCS